MPLCLFCSSENHETSKCEEYVTEEEKKVIAKKKNICLSCFARSAVPHSVGKDCKNDEICGAWYSTEHHTVFCPKRVKAQEIFFPSIDEHLWPRFFQTLDLDEQFSLKLSSPIGQKYITLKNLQIMSLLDSGDFWGILISNNLLVIISTLILRGSPENVVFKGIKEKIIICRAKILQLRYNKYSVQDLSKVINSYTKEITIRNIMSNITFTEIIQFAPNIEVFEMLDFSLKLDEKTWINDLMKYKKGKNFRHLSLCLHGIEFDVENLKKFIATKSINDVIIKIRYESTNLREDYNVFIEKNSKHFIEELHPLEGQNIILGYNLSNDFRSFIFNMNTTNAEAVAMAAKNRKTMPSRSAKKRCLKYNEI